MKTQEKKIIANVAASVKEKLANEGSGHDWWHSFRVWKNAQAIAKEEGDVDHFVIELAALLHDIADWKDYDGDETVGPAAAREILRREHVSDSIVDHVADIIRTISFKGAGVVFAMRSHEGEIVQDADRLDAIGAIGVARAFAYGGSRGKLLYDPDIKPVLSATKEAYLKNNATTINHFYEKLLLLKDLMKTETAKKIALHRHQYLESFLEEFYAEWEGKR